MNTKLKIVGGGALVAVLGLVGVAWWLGLFSEEPAEVSVEDAAATVAGDDAATEGDTTGASADGDAAAVTDLTGTWTVATSDATFVGYRVQEVLSTIGDFTAVGRTPAVVGELTADGTTITAVSITADLTQLESDSSSRDRQLSSQALETATFPEATFVLTQPIELASIPAEGETITAEAVGDLTLHGVTNSITLSIEGTTTGGTLVVVGSTDIAMGDYDITPPQAPVVASVDELAVMELSLVFER